MSMEKRKINAQEIVGDIRAGMSSVDLMEKYVLDEKQLNELLQRLNGEGLITRWQMFDLTTLSDSAVMEAFGNTGRSGNKPHVLVSIEMKQATNPGYFLGSAKQASSGETTLRMELERLLRENRSHMPRRSGTDSEV